MKKVAIQFSGGKDSLVVIHLLKKIGVDFTAYFCDTGDMYPHVVEFVKKTCSDLSVPLRIVGPKQKMEDYQAENGLPSDIVPVSKVREMRETYGNKGQILQGSIACCSVMLWAPLQDAMINDDIRVIVRGAKAADDHVGVPDGFIDDRGVLYKNPLWNWSDADVYKYLSDHNISLPEHYSEVKNSFDCVGCTAFLDGAGEPGRLAWTKKHLPVRWEKLKSNIQIVRSVIDGERERLNKSFAVCED